MPTALDAEIRSFRNSRLAIATPQYDRLNNGNATLKATACNAAIQRKSSTP